MSDNYPNQIELSAFKFSISRLYLDLVKESNVHDNDLKLAQKSFLYLAKVYSENPNKIAVVLEEYAQVFPFALLLWARNMSKASKVSFHLKFPIEFMVQSIFGFIELKEKVYEMLLIMNILLGRTVNDFTLRNIMMNSEYKTLIASWTDFTLNETDVTAIDSVNDVKADHSQGIIPDFFFRENENTQFSVKACFMRSLLENDGLNNLFSVIESIDVESMSLNEDTIKTEKKILALLDVLKSLILSDSNSINEIVLEYSFWEKFNVTIPNFIIASMKLIYKHLLIPHKFVSNDEFGKDFVTISKIIEPLREMYNIFLEINYNNPGINKYISYLGMSSQLLESINRSLMRNKDNIYLPNCLYNAGHGIRQEDVELDAHSTPPWFISSKMVENVMFSLQMPFNLLSLFHDIHKKCTLKNIKEIDKPIKVPEDVEEFLVSSDNLAILLKLICQSLEKVEMLSRLPKLESKRNLKSYPFGDSFDLEIIIQLLSFINTSIDCLSEMLLTFNFKIDESSIKENATLLSRIYSSFDMLLDKKSLFQNLSPDSSKKITSIHKKILSSVRLASLVKLSYILITKNIRLAEETASHLGFSNDSNFVEMMKHNSQSLMLVVVYSFYNYSNNQEKFKGEIMVLWKNLFEYLSSPKHTLVNVETIQFICFLAGKVPGLSLKRFIYKSMTPSLIKMSTNLPLFVPEKFNAFLQILKYQIYYYYESPDYLYEQIKAHFMPNSGTTSDNKSLIYSHEDEKLEFERILTYLGDESCANDFFYDLSIPGSSRENADSRKNDIDSLSIPELLHRVDYCKFFDSLMTLFSQVLIRNLDSLEDRLKNPYHLSHALKTIMPIMNHISPSIDLFERLTKKPENKAPMNPGTFFFAVTFLEKLARKTKRDVSIKMLIEEIKSAGPPKTVENDALDLQLISKNILRVFQSNGSKESSSINKDEDQKIISDQIMALSSRENVNLLLLDEVELILLDLLKIFQNNRKINIEEVIYYKAIVCIFMDILKDLYKTHPIREITKEDETDSSVTALAKKSVHLLSLVIDLLESSSSWMKRVEFAMSKGTNKMTDYLVMLPEKIRNLENCQIYFNDQSVVSKASVILSGKTTSALCQSLEALIEYNSNGDLNGLKNWLSVTSPATWKVVRNCGQVFSHSKNSKTPEGEQGKTSTSQHAKDLGQMFVNSIESDVKTLRKSITSFVEMDGKFKITSDCHNLFQKNLFEKMRDLLSNLGYSANLMAGELMRLPRNKILSYFTQNFSPSNRDDEDGQVLPNTLLERLAKMFYDPILSRIDSDLYFNDGSSPYTVAEYISYMINYCNRSESHDSKESLGRGTLSRRHYAQNSLIKMLIEVLGKTLIKKYCLFNFDHFTEEEEVKILKNLHTASLQYLEVFIASYDRALDLSILMNIFDTKDFMNIFSQEIPLTAYYSQDISANVVRFLIFLLLLTLNAKRNDQKVLSQFSTNAIRAFILCESDKSILKACLCLYGKFEYEIEDEINEKLKTLSNVENEFIEHFIPTEMVLKDFPASFEIVQFIDERLKENRSDRVIDLFQSFLRIFNVYTKTPKLFISDNWDETHPSLTLLTEMLNVWKKRLSNGNEQLSSLDDSELHVMFNYLPSYLNSIEGVVIASESSSGHVSVICLYKSILRLLSPFVTSILNDISGHAAFSAAKKAYCQKMFDSVQEILNYFSNILCALNKSYKIKEMSECKPKMTSEDIFRMTNLPKFSSRLADCETSLRGNTSGYSYFSKRLEAEFSDEESADPRTEVWRNAFKEIGKNERIEFSNDSLCTYLAGRSVFVDQHWYHCYTCNLVGSEGVCSVCARTCHKGHDIVYSKSDSFYCDCGGITALGITDDTRKNWSLHKKMKPCCSLTRCMGRKYNTSQLEELDMSKVFDRAVIRPWLIDYYNLTQEPNAVRDNANSLSNDDFRRKENSRKNKKQPRPLPRKNFVNSGKTRRFPQGSTMPQTNTLQTNISSSNKNLVTSTSFGSKRCNAIRRKHGVGRCLVGQNTGINIGNGRMKAINEEKKGPTANETEMKPEVVPEVAVKTVGDNSLRKGAWMHLRNQKRRRYAELLYYSSMLARKQRRYENKQKLYERYEDYKNLVPNNDAIISLIRTAFKSAPESTRQDVITSIIDDDNLKLISNLISKNTSLTNLFEASRILNQSRERSLRQMERPNADFQVHIIDDLNMPIVNYMPNESEDYVANSLIEVMKLITTMDYEKIEKYLGNDLTTSEVKSPSAQTPKKSTKSNKPPLPPGQRKLTNFWDAERITDIEDSSSLLASSAGQRSVDSNSSTLESISNNRNLFLQALSSVLNQPTSSGCRIWASSHSAISALQMVCGNSSRTGQLTKGSMLLNDNTSNIVHPSMISSGTNIAVLSVPSGKGLAHCQHEAHDYATNKKSCQCLPIGKTVHNFLIISGSPTFTQAASNSPTNTKPGVSSSSNPGSSTTPNQDYKGRIIIYSLDEVIGEAVESQNQSERRIIKSFIKNSKKYSRKSTASLTEMVEKIVDPVNSPEIDESVFEKSTKILSKENLESISKIEQFSKSYKDLTRVGHAAVPFVVKSLCVNPSSESVCALVGTRELVIISLNTNGQITGRVFLTPVLESKTEVIIKCIWLPASKNLIAILTNQSLQIFNIFSPDQSDTSLSVKEPLYFFKPVEGRFCDATFVHLPMKVVDHETMTEEWNNILLIMSQNGTIFHQRLSPQCHYTTGQYFIVETLEWHHDKLKEYTGESVEFKREPNSGQMGDGGISIFYNNKDEHSGYLYHSYNNGMTILTRITSENDEIVIGESDSYLVTSASTTKTTNIASDQGKELVVIKPNQMNKLILVKSLFSKTFNFSQLSFDHSVRLSSSPLTKFTSVRGDPTLILSMPVDAHSKGNNYLHKSPMLIAHEPKNIFLCPINLYSANNANTLVDSTKSNEEEKKNVKGNVINAVKYLDSIPFHWSGNQDQESSRTFIITLSEDGRLYFSSSRPKQKKFVKDDVNSVSLLPGNNGESYEKMQTMLDEIAERQNASENLLFDPKHQYETGPIWNVSFGQFSEATNKKIISRKSSVDRFLLDEISMGELPVNILNFAKTTDNIVFGGMDLLTIYSREQLKKRLSIKNQDAENLIVTGFNISTTQKSYYSNAIPTHQLAFIVEIGLTDDEPTDSAIFGLRITLPVKTKSSEKEQVDIMKKWPKYFFVFGRSIPVPPREKENKIPRIINIPLYRSEILKTNRIISLGVGPSDSEDGFVNIGSIEVFVIDRQEIENSSPLCGLGAEEDDEFNNDLVTHFLQSNIDQETPSNKELVNVTKIAKRFDRLHYLGLVSFPMPKLAAFGFYSHKRIITQKNQSLLDLDTILSTALDFVSSAKVFTENHLESINRRIFEAFETFPIASKSGIELISRNLSKLSISHQEKVELFKKMYINEIAAFSAIVEDAEREFKPELLLSIIKCMKNIKNIILFNSYLAENKKADFNVDQLLKGLKSCLVIYLAYDKSLAIDLNSSTRSNERVRLRSHFSKLLFDLLYSTLISLAETNHEIINFFIDLLTLEQTQVSVCIRNLLTRHVSMLWFSGNQFQGNLLTWHNGPDDALDDDEAEMNRPDFIKRLPKKTHKSEKSISLIDGSTNEATASSHIQSFLNMIAYMDDDEGPDNSRHYSPDESSKKKNKKDEIIEEDGEEDAEMFDAGEETDQISNPHNESFFETVDNEGNYRLSHLFDLIADRHGNEEDVEDEDYEDVGEEEEEEEEEEDDEEDDEEDYDDEDDANEEEEEFDLDEDEIDDEQLFSEEPCGVVYPEEIVCGFSSVGPKMKDRKTRKRMKTDSRSNKKTVSNDDAHDQENANDPNRNDPVVIDLTSENDRDQEHPATEEMDIDDEYNSVMPSLNEGENEFTGMLISMLGENALLDLALHMTMRDETSEENRDAHENNLVDPFSFHSAEDASSSQTTFVPKETTNDSENANEASVEDQNKETENTPVHADEAVLPEDKDPWFSGTDDEDIKRVHDEIKSSQQTPSRKQSIINDSGDESDDGSIIFEGSKTSRPKPDGPADSGDDDPFEVPSKTSLTSQRVFSIKLVMAFVKVMAERWGEKQSTTSSMKRFIPLYQTAYSFLRIMQSQYSEMLLVNQKQSSQYISSCIATDNQWCIIMDSIEIILQFFIKSALNRLCEAIETMSEHDATIENDSTDCAIINFYMNMSLINGVIDEPKHAKLLLEPKSSFRGILEKFMVDKEFDFANLAATVDLANLTSISASSAVLFFGLIMIEALMKKWNVHSKLTDVNNVQNNSFLPVQIGKNSFKTKASLDQTSVQQDDPFSIGLLQSIMQINLSHDNFGVGHDLIMGLYPIFSDQFVLSRCGNPFQDLYFSTTMTTLETLNKLIKRDSNKLKSEKKTLISHNFEVKWWSLLLKFHESSSKVDNEKVHVTIDRYGLQREQITKEIESLLQETVGISDYKKIADITRIGNYVSSVKAVCLEANMMTLDDVAQKGDASLLTEASSIPIILNNMHRQEIFLNLKRIMSIARSEISHWHSFCQKCPDLVFFLFHSTLVLPKEIILVVMELLSMSFTSVRDSSETLIEFEKEKKSIVLESMETYYLSLKKIPAKMESIRFILVQVIRVFLCHSQNKSVRENTMSICKSLYSHPNQFRSFVLESIEVCWAELSTFVPFSDKLMELTSYILLNRLENDEKINQLVKNLAMTAFANVEKNIDLISTNPKRSFYTTFTRFVNMPSPHEDHGSLGSILSGQLFTSFEGNPCLLCYNENNVKTKPILLSWDTHTTSSASTTNNNNEALRRNDLDELDRLNQYVKTFNEQINGTTNVMKRFIEKFTKSDISRIASSRKLNELLADSSNTHDASETDFNLQVNSIQPMSSAGGSVHFYDLQNVMAISQINIRFNISPKRPKYPKLINIYTFETFSSVSGSQIIQEPQLWNKVASVHFSRDQSQAIFWFSSNDLHKDQPIPMPSSKTKNISLSNEISASIALSGDGKGLPIIASRLIIEYADFYSFGTPVNGGGLEKRSCPRCHSAAVFGNVCMMCKNNINQCLRCRSIILSNADTYLCSNCGSSAYGKIEFMVIGKRCHGHVHDLKDRDDRDSALNKILSMDLDQHASLDPNEESGKLRNVKAKASLPVLSKERVVSNQAFQSLCSTLNGISTMDAAEQAEEYFSNSYKNINTDQITNSSYVRYVFNLMMNGGCSIHPDIENLIRIYAKNCALSMDSVSKFRELWAIKSAIMHFDKRQMLNGVNSMKSTSLSLQSRTLNHVKIIASRGSCYQCQLNTLSVYLNILQTILGHFPFHHLTSLLNDMMSENRLKKLIDDLFYKMLVCVPHKIQVKIQDFLLLLSSQTKSLVLHLDQALSTRLLKIADSEAEQAFLMPAIVNHDIDLITSSIYTILSHDNSTSNTSLSKDHLLSLRIKTIFNILEVLSSRPKSLRSVPVMHNIFMPCVKLLEHVIVSTKGSEKTSRLSTKKLFNVLPRICLEYNDWMQETGIHTYQLWKESRVNFDIYPHKYKDRLTEPKKLREMLLEGKYFAKWRVAARRSKIGHKYGLSLRMASFDQDYLMCNNWLVDLLFTPHDPLQECARLSLSLFTYLARDPARIDSVLINISSNCLPRIGELVWHKGFTPIHRTSADYLWLGLKGILASNSQDEKIIKDIEDYFTKIRNPNYKLISGSAESQSNVDNHISKMNLLLNYGFLDTLQKLLEENLKKLTDLEKLDQLMISSDMQDLGKLSLPFQNWHQSIATQMNNVSGYERSESSNPAFVISIISEMLQLLHPVKCLSSKHRNQLIKCLLHACVQLTNLRIQRTHLTITSQSILTAMLDQSTKSDGLQIREFLDISLSVLAEYPLDDTNSSPYILRYMCAPVCPLETFDTPVFMVSLEIFRGHEDYLPTRTTNHTVRSDTRGLGPRIQELMDYLCTENNLTLDMRLEILCNNQVLMPQLRLQDVYTHLWCQDVENVDRPMRLIYRIPGLESDNLPYVERLHARSIPAEKYGNLAEIARHPHGLGEIIQRLESVQDIRSSRDFVIICLHLLKYCLKVDACRDALIDANNKALSALLNVLLSCLSIGGVQKTNSSDHTNSELHDEITLPYVKMILELIKLKSHTGSLNEVVSDEKFYALLNQTDCLSHLPFIRTEVIKIPALIISNKKDRIDQVVNFIVSRVDVGSLLVPGKNLSLSEQERVEVVANLLLLIPRNEEGIFIRTCINDRLHLASLGFKYLWTIVPSLVHTMGNTDEIDVQDQSVQQFMNEPAVQPTLRILRSCCLGKELTTDHYFNHLTSNENVPLQDLVEADTKRDCYQMFLFLHKIEIGKGTNDIGLLSEDFLNDWIDCGKDNQDPNSVSRLIKSIRDLTRDKNRKMAEEVRNRELSKLNMAVNADGLVSLIPNSDISKMVEMIDDDNGFCCAICQDGYCSAPGNLLGLYCYHAQKRIEERVTIKVNLLESTQKLPPHVELIRENEEVSLRMNISEPNDSLYLLSNSVFIHYQCHQKSFNSSSETEWIVAQRNNRDIKCNFLLPITQPEVADVGLENEIKAKMNEMIGKLQIGEGKFDIFMNSLKMLLLNFGLQKTFHNEAGGGSREKTIGLIPHLVQLAIYFLSDWKEERRKIDNFLADHQSHENALFMAVKSLVLFNYEEWSPAVKTRLLKAIIGHVHAKCQPYRDCIRKKMISVSHIDEWNVYKPYLFFLGMIDSIFQNFIQEIQPTSDTSNWSDTLHNYIRNNDEKIILLMPKILAYFNENIVVCESFDEYIDVMGLYGEFNLENDVLRLDEKYE